MKKVTLLNVKDLQAKKPAELEKYIQELKEQLQTVVHEISVNKQKQTHLVGSTKRAIARARTVATQVAAQSVEKKEK